MIVTLVCSQGRFFGTVKFCTCYKSVADFFFLPTANNISRYEQIISLSSKYKFLPIVLVSSYHGDPFRLKSCHVSFTLHPTEFSRTLLTRNEVFYKSVSVGNP